MLVYRIDATFIKISPFEFYISNRLIGNWDDIKRAAFRFAHEWTNWKSCNQIYSSGRLPIENSGGSWFRKRWIIWQMPLRNPLILKCRKKTVRSRVRYQIKLLLIFCDDIFKSNQNFSCFFSCSLSQFIVRIAHSNEISFENSIGINSAKTFRSRGWNIHKAIEDL